MIESHFVKNAKRDKSGRRARVTGWLQPVTREESKNFGILTRFGLLTSNGLKFFVFNSDLSDSKAKISRIQCRISLEYSWTNNPWPWSSGWVFIRRLPEKWSISHRVTWWTNPKPINKFNWLLNWTHFIILRSMEPFGTNLEVNWKIYKVKDEIALQVAKVLIDYPNLSGIEPNLTHISKMILETKCKWWDSTKRQKYACNDNLFS